MSKIEQWYQTAYKHQTAGNLAAAEPLYRRILEKQPRHLEAIYLLGSLCAQQSRYAEALPLLERALAIRPQFTEALNNRGVALAALGRWDEALDSYAAAVRLRPDYAEALNNQGIALQKAGRLEEAIDSFQKASAFRTDYAQALNNLGIAYKAVDRKEEAETAFRSAMAAQSDYPEAVNNVGLTHLSRGQFEDALQLFDRAIVLQPDFPQAHNNRAASLKELGRYEEAQAGYVRVFSLKPDYVEAYYNLGTCLVAAGRLDEAKAYYDKALAIKPDDVNAHWNRALGLLVAGDYEEGWREYEWRFRCKAVTERISSQPRWDGSPLAGRTILVHAEQGFGDTLNFLRYLPLVKAAGGRVLFECQPALLSLLDGCPGIDLLLGPPPKGQDHTEPYDVQIPLLSLPGIFGTTPDTIPAETPRLQTPLHFAEAWRARLEEIVSSVPGRLKVGLVWAGNPSHKNDHNRSCSLAALAPLGQVPGVVFYSLQKGPAAAQAAAAPAGMTLIDLGPALADFADTAAVIEQLDLVIAVDTSVVHLAGALGKPTWMLTPHSPDWRWFLDREDSPWYSSVRLFRQPGPQEWEPVISRITSELHAFAAALAPAEAQDLVSRGEAYYASGDTVQAMRCFEEAITQDPADARALNNVAVLAYGAGGYDAAIQVLTQALAAEPDHAGALENMARCREAKGEYPQAAGWYQKALAVAPHSTALWNAFGHLCLRLGETQAAREVFEQSLALDDTQQPVRDALAALTAETAAEEIVPVPTPPTISPEIFLRSFRRADLDAYCRSFYSAGEMLARTAYARRDSAAIHAGGVANADSRFAQAEQEWNKIAARLGELKALEQAGYAAVSRLPEWETQLRPALEVFCRTGAEYHLLAGYLKGRTDRDARMPTASPAQDSLVSIVVACYNYAHFLPETVASVLAQTYQNWELIIVNDGSTDNTAEVAAEIIAAHPDRQIRVINQQNKRLAGARNSGIREARGRYILPLDADDMIESTMLAQCVAVLDAHPDLSMAYPDQTHFNEQSEVWKAYSLDWDYAQELSYNLVCVCCLFRRSMWEEAGGYREDCIGAEDWDFWIKCGERGHQAWRIPQALFRYRKHGASLSVTDAPRHDYLKADIILHHPHLYSPATVRWARGVAAGYEWLHPIAGWTPRPATALVSVIVPTYNRSQMLVHALESILAQTYQNFEIIVVNDAGEDVSHVIEPLNAEGRITLINKPANKGLADSRNVGIAAARGRYIAYLDDDDLYYADHLETLVTFLENTGFQVAYADALRAHQRKGPDGKYETWHRDQPYSRDFDYDVILTGNFSPVQCYMHEKACLDEVGLFDTTLSSHEDWDLWLRLSRRFDCVHLKKTTSEFTWRQDGSSMTSKQQRDYQRTTAMIYRKSRVFAQDNPHLLAHYDAFLQQWEQIENTPAAAPTKQEAAAQPITIALTARLVKERGLDPYKPCPCGSGKRLKFCHYGKEIDAKVLAQATQDWKTDVIVVVHNQLDYTRRCVESLYRHTKDFHLLLWDNGSDASTRAYLEEIGRRENVTLCRSEENLGFIVPNNRLAAQGNAPYLILLNSDTEVRSGWDSALRSYLDARPETGAVGYEGGLLGPDALGCGQGRGDEIDYVAGWCLCLARQTYETHGLFDEQNLQFAYGEDSDFSLRLQEAGLRLHVLPESRVTHFGNKTINAVSQKRDTRPTFQANHAYLRRRWAAYLAQDRVLARQERTRREAWERQIAEAEAIYAQGDPVGAVERFQALSAQEPTDIRVLNNLGVILWQQGKATEGLRYFVQALQTDMDDRTTVLNCAEALQALGQTEDARQLLDVFLQKHSEDAEAAALRGRLQGTIENERIAA